MVHPHDGRFSVKHPGTTCENGVNPEERLTFEATRVYFYRTYLFGNGGEHEAQDGSRFQAATGRSRTLMPQDWQPKPTNDLEMIIENSLRLLVGNRVHGP